MEVQIMSRETIKPSFPTPDHLRTHKFGAFDQFIPFHYIPMLLFYSARDQSPTINMSNRLKTSLSKALTRFYPLAGRVRGDLTIDCNDDGATFAEAQVSWGMSFVLQEPEFDILQQLLPQIQPSTDQVLLAVQANYFACGGMALAVRISHVAADASAAANFLKAWAQVACGAADTIVGVTYDLYSLFPPRDLSGVEGVVSNMANVESLQDEVILKRFLFDGPKIAALRSEMGDELNSYHPTRVEAVTALIWGALIAATAENVTTPPILAATIAVNLRNRMNPPLPPQCIGNVSFAAIASTQIKSNENRRSLARKIHQSIKLVDDEYIRKLFTSDGEWEKNLEQVLKNFNTRMNFSSWCRFPFYEADFGWGKPIWFGYVSKQKRSARFLDTSDGKGIEAWIALTKEEMAKLEQDPDILAYSNFKPSI